MRRETALIQGYGLIGLATFCYLTFFDGYNYTASNWLIAIPANWFLSMIWPLYWAIIRPMSGS